MNNTEVLQKVHCWKQSEFPFVFDLVYKYLPGESHARSDQQNADDKTHH